MPSNTALLECQARASFAGFSAPVYANGALYVPDGGGHIVAYDANTGRVRWTSAHIGDIVSAPTVTSDTVYAGVDGNGVVALSVSNGAQRAKFATDSEVFASPVIETGILYAGCESGGLYAFDVTTRVQLWRFNAGAPLHGHPAVANGMAILGAGNSLIAIDSSGREKWRLAATHGGWSPSLAVAGGMVYASDGNVLRAVSLFTGFEVWSYQGSGAWTASAAANGLVITGSSDNKVTALDAAAGTFVWQATLKNATEVIVADGVVYGGTANFNANPNETAAEKLYALDALIGQTLWTFDVVGEVRTGAAVGGGKVFVTTLGRNVYALD
jgi:outer membrane protein assembly factor BamB